MTDIAIADEPEQPEFEEDVPDLAAAGDPLIVDVDGFEGPMDLLLTLARTQKVDLKKISILALADQYLTFIATAKRMKLEVAADYLVMASWLAYLKSRLLLPPPHEDDEPTGEELAARLAFQLQRLEAMRNVAARLMARNRLGRDVFARGMPEGIRVIRTPHYADTLYDLLKAYTRQRAKESVQEIEIVRAPVYAIDEARTRLERMLGRIPEWARLDSLLPPDLMQSGFRRSALASSFTAGLAMVRDGVMEIRQLAHFGPIYVKQRPPGERDGLEEPTPPDRETFQETAEPAESAASAEPAEDESAWQAPAHKPFLRNEEPEKDSEELKEPEAPNSDETGPSVPSFEACRKIEEIEERDISSEATKKEPESLSAAMESSQQANEMEEHLAPEETMGDVTLLHSTTVEPLPEPEEIEEQKVPEGSEGSDGPKGNES